MKQWLKNNSSWLITTLLLMLITCLALYFRIYKVGSDPLWGDEFGYFYLDNLPVASNRLFNTYDFLIRGYAHFLHLCGHHLYELFWLRLAPALLGTLSIVLLFDWVRRLTNRQIALVAAALMAVAWDHISLSRVSKHYVYMYFAAVWILDTMTACVQKGKWYHCPLLIGGCVFGFFTHSMTPVIIIGSAIYAGIMLIWQSIILRKIQWQKIIFFSISGVIILSVCLPIFLNFVYPAMQKGGKLALGSSTPSILSKFTWKAMISGFGLGLPIFKKCYIFLLVTGAICSLRFFRAWLFTAIIFFVTWLVLANLHVNIRFIPNYIGYTYPFFILLVSIAIWQLSQLIAYIFKKIINILLWRWRKTNFVNKSGKIIFSFVFICLILIMVGWLWLGNTMIILQYKNVYRRGDWRVSAEFLKRSINKGILLTGPTEHLFRNFDKKPSYTCESFTRAYDCRNVSSGKIKEKMKCHDTLWATFVNRYMRWNRNPSANFMDKEWIQIPTVVNIHYWDKNEAILWKKDVKIKAKKAVELMDEFLEVDSEHYLVQLEKAKWLGYLNKRKEALNLYKKLFKEYPFNQYVIKKIAESYENGFGTEKNPPKASKWYWWYNFNNYLARDVVDVGITIKRSLCYQNAGLIDNSIDILENLILKIETNKKYARYRSSLGKCYTNLGDYYAKAQEYISATNCYTYALKNNANKTQISKKIKKCCLQIKAKSIVKPILYTDREHWPKFVPPTREEIKGFSKPFPIKCQKTKPPFRTLNKLTTGKKVKIIVIGDSIAASPWEKPLKQKIEKQYPRSKVEIINRATGSYSTYQIEKMLFSDAVVEYPDCIIIHTSGNEKWNIDGFYKRYAKILSRLRWWTGADIVLLTPSPTTSPIGVSNNNPKYYWSIIKLAQLFNCSVADIHVYIQNCGRPVSEITVDGTHPNKSGNELVANAIMDLFSENQRKKIAEPCGWKEKTAVSIINEKSRYWSISKNGTITYSGTNSYLKICHDWYGSGLAWYFSCPSGINGQVYFKIDDYVPAEHPKVFKWITTPEANQANISNGKHVLGGKIHKSKPLQIYATRNAAPSRWELNFTSPNSFSLISDIAGEIDSFDKDTIDTINQDNNKMFYFNSKDIWWTNQKGLYYANDKCFFDVCIAAPNGPTKIIGKTNISVRVIGGLEPVKHTACIIFKSKQPLTGLELLHFEEEHPLRNFIPGYK